MWLTETHIPQPKKVFESDGNLEIREFIGLASQGTAVRWLGDYHRAKDFLISLDKRTQKTAKTPPAEASLQERFHLHRQLQASRARLQARLLIRIEPDFQFRYRAPQMFLWQ